MNVIKNIIITILLGLITVIIVVASVLVIIISIIALLIDDYEIVSKYFGYLKEIYMM